MRTLRHFVVILALLPLVGCTGTPIKPSREEESVNRTTRQVVGVGCFLQASGSGSSLGELAAAGLIYFPSGNLALDAFYQKEGLGLVNTYGVFPRGFYFVDQPPNAMATPEIANSLGPDGTILFGQNMLVQQLSRDPTGATLVAVMAHEFAHIAQFRGGVREPGKRTELHADFMAGWYLNLRGRYAWTNLSPALRLFYELGDYQFNSPSHHGTPQERMSAAQAGFNSGAQSALDAYTLGWRFVG